MTAHEDLGREIADYLERRPLAEPWLDKRRLAEHLACSVRSIETALAEGLPHAVIFGRVKFRVTEVEPWLADHGHLERVGSSATLGAETKRPGGAVNAPGPDTRSKPHASQKA